MIESVVECDDLLDNEAFMTCFMFSMQQTIIAYQTILDYSAMIASFATIEYNLLDLNDIDTWNDILNSLEKLDELASNFLLKLNMYNYFLKNYNIYEDDFLDNIKQYGSKRAKELLSSRPYTSLEIIPGGEDVEELDLPGLDEEVKEQTTEYMIN
uniref:Uncharacterized protein n=1 Tax=Euplotes crassus TaxID=5936 RepID=A0A7S3NZ26_EUPCR|mmetsp:Transcript_8824/g.8366  ORF Transcript_8824/g.8366 Transcript_8824/m.8366 type:complete len:155 (+) Transcript_8824:533-997(+)